MKGQFEALGRLIMDGMAQVLEEVGYNIVK